MAAGAMCVLAACTSRSNGNGNGDAPAANAGAGASAAGSGGESGTLGGGGAGPSGSGGALGSSGAGSSSVAGAGGAAGMGGAGSSSSGAGGRGGTSAPAAGTGGPGGAGGQGGTTASQPLAARVCPQGTAFGSPLPGGSPSATMVQGGFMFIEGPVWVADKGWLLFSDMDFGGGDAMGPKSRIRRLVPPSTFDVFVEQANSNGLALDLDGAVLACTHDLQTLSRYLPANGMRETRSLTYMGKHFNSPNDLTVRSDGIAYFTDPDWQLGPRSNETGMTGVYRVNTDDSVQLVEGTLQKPNGIALSPDEKTLYVGSSQAEIYAYPVNPEGGVGAKSVFARPGGSDGMTVDCAGNLYVAGSDSVKVYAPSRGADDPPLGMISVGVTTSNVAFGGSDRKTLFITAGNTLYSIVLQVPGLPY
ncbi:MAG TPA: SMP-30/gluconolactonase/LRE family protein [Polyangiales bacterium]|nr:SMP-30/gluconolactonase/LRE family protein [Polyangiales bacterium]